MKEVYYTNPLYPGRVAKVVCSDDLSELEFVLNKGDSYLVVDDDKSNSIPVKVELDYFNCLSFDDMSKPTKVIVDIELAKIKFMERIRSDRDKKLQETDYELTLATNYGYTELLPEIMDDKRVLRDLPDTIDLSLVKSVEDFYRITPVELEIDYRSKYESLRESIKNRKSKS